MCPPIRDAPTCSSCASALYVKCPAGVIGLWLRDIEAAIAKGKSLGEIRGLLDSSGLRVGELCFLGGWHDAADEAQFKEVLSQTRRICEVARALACEIVATVPALGPGWVKRGPERFRQVCKVAADYRVRMALEFAGVAAEVKDLRSARDLIIAAACPNGGLLIDTFHFFLGGSKVTDFERVAPGEVFLVHVSDAMNLPPEMLRIPGDNRTFPGEGIIDFAPIFKELNRLEYDGTISLEIWNRQFHRSDPAEVVKRGCESLQQIESTLRNKLRGIVEG